MKYPLIEVNLTKLEHNVRTLNGVCKAHKINTMAVTKCFCALEPMVEAVVAGGVDFLADSRIENLERMKGFDLPKVLLRLPMASEVERVVAAADISNNSELATLRLLDAEAARQGKTHGVILMVDLGDLREGVWPTEVDATVEEILKLGHIRLVGVGVNLTCYGGVIPDESNLGKLCDIAAGIEAKFGIQLDIVSGGNSSSLYLLDKSRMPARVNNLRPGEAYLLGRETAYGENIPNTHPDVFTFKAQIIELKEKQSVPIGEIGMDAFGNKPTYTDRGIRKRAILGVGRQDVNPASLTLKDEGIIILGASSDHLILDVTDAAKAYQVGDVVEFGVDYGSLLQLMTSEYIGKQMVK